MNATDVTDEFMLETLKKYWHFDAFREGQMEILKSILSGKDTIAILPTGGGKSLCYQLPAVLTGKITLVVSPLLALMRDQAHHLTEIGIRTCCFNSELKPVELLRQVQNISNFQVIYATPEWLLNNTKLLAELRDQERLGLIAIDEAHCASAWGHDFRPSYLRLGELRPLLQSIPNQVVNTGNQMKSGGGFGVIPRHLSEQDEDSINDIDAPKVATNHSYQRTIPILALTATAPPSVIRDIAKILRMQNTQVVIGNLGRKNLFLRCLKKTTPKDPAVDIAPHIDANKNTIIYTIKKDETDLIYVGLSQQFPELVKCGKIARYHADLGQQVKQSIYEKFIAGEITVLIATIAFGMGIDKKDIRMVINWGAPSNIETYYQEIGRAGRDNFPSSCVLFWAESDLSLSRFHIMEGAKRGTQSQAIAKENLRKIGIMEDFLRGSDCRISTIIRYFKSEIDSNDNRPPYACNNCDNCYRYNSEKIIIRQDNPYNQQNNSYGCSPSVPKWANNLGRSEDSDESPVFVPVLPPIPENKAAASQDEKVEDYGPHAKLLFALMASVQVNFGANMLISILRGSKNQRMTTKLMALPSYGKGHDRSEKWWKAFIRFFLIQGYIKRLPTQIAGRLVELLELTPKAKAWLAKKDPSLVLRQDDELIAHGLKR
jgi:superfamily II DNA helicase RecQ